MEFPMRYLYLNLFSNEYLKRWYGFKEFSPYNVIIGDLFYMLVGLVIAYRIHAYFFAGIDDPLVKFGLLFGVFWIVQMVGDMLFYQIISQLGRDNKWICFFQDYGKSAKLNAVFGDSAYILVWALTAYAIHGLPQDVLMGLFFLYVFILSILDAGY
jgi:hypothetical protein